MKKMISLSQLVLSGKWDFHFPTAIRDENKRSANMTAEAEYIFNLSPFM